MASNESEMPVLPLWLWLASERDDVNASNCSAPMKKPKKTKSGTMLQAWSFQMTVKAYLLHCISAQAKMRLLPKKVPSHWSAPFAMNPCSLNKPKARVLFQLWSTDICRQKMLIHFSLCRTLSILPPGNQSLEAWQATQSSMPTLWHCCFEHSITR